MTPDRWDSLQALTPARVALGRAGGSIPTSAHLRFRADHARARDAVNHTFDAELVVAELTERGHRSIAVTSSATSRQEYVRRPDLGRVVSGESAAALRAVTLTSCDLAVVVCDGLSPGAAQRYGAGLAEAIDRHDRLSDWSIGVTSVATNGRVAIGDQIGAILAARIVVVLIGERPGLSIFESIGAYVTYEPRPGRTDAERNCVSNIHDRGLALDEAARRIVNLVVRARAGGLTGVDLKADDPTEALSPPDYP